MPPPLLPPAAVAQDSCCLTPSPPHPVLGEEKCHQWTWDLGGGGIQQRREADRDRAKCSLGQNRSPEAVINTDLRESKSGKEGWGMGAGGLGRGGMCSRDAARAKGIYPNNSSKTMSAPAQEKHTEKGGSQRRGGRVA